MLRVVTASRLDPLADWLAGTMARAPLPPLVPETLVVAQNEQPQMYAQFANRGEVNIVHWRKNGYAYALVGKLEIESGDLTTLGAARALGVCEGTVRALVRRGELPAIRLSSGMRIYRRLDVDRVRAARAANVKQGR